MILARVAGRITSTIHHPDMNGRKLLILDKLDAMGRTTGSRTVESLLRGAEITPAELRARAEAWRPWRAYAAMHLWCGSTR